MVKAEDTQQSTSSAYPTWSPSEVPIDPALQTPSQQTTQTPYGHYQAYAHYNPANYAQQYQQYAANTQATTPAAASSQAQNASSSKQDNSDVDALKDAIGSAGVDLRAEEESLQRTQDSAQIYRHQEDRTRKQPIKPSFDARFLGATMRSIGTEHKVTQVPEDSVTYLALALRARLQSLIEAMIAASAHRTDTQFDRPASLYPDGSPMWSIVIRSDVAKQLAALEKVEREEEQRLRRERKERADAQAAQVSALEAAAAAGAEAYDEDGAPKKKKKKEGPGVTARNMSEDIRKKISNATASQAAGISTAKYSWMSGGAGAGAQKKAAAAAATATATPAVTSTTAAPATPAPAPAGSWAKPYVSATKPAPAPATPEDTRRSVTLRDALFVIEKERGHGGGRGSARGWV
jgi:hypothetical protein